MSTDDRVSDDELLRVVGNAPPHGSLAEYRALFNAGFDECAREVMQIVERGTLDVPDAAEIRRRLDALNGLPHEPMDAKKPDATG